MAALRAAIAADERDGVVPVAVAGTAGTTGTGAIDPLGDLAQIAREHGAWFHVDGACGLIAAVAGPGPVIAARTNGWPPGPAARLPMSATPGS